jgi:hypothetical protein
LALINEVFTKTYGSHDRLFTELVAGLRKAIVWPVELGRVQFFSYQILLPAAAFSYYQYAIWITFISLIGALKESSSSA